MNKNSGLTSLSGSRLVTPFVLVVATVLVAIFLIMSLAPAKPVAKEPGTAGNEIKKVEKKDPVDFVKMENNYKISVAKIVGEFLAIAEQDHSTVDQVEKTKQELLDLKVPTKYKDLHISLVMAMVKMENFIANGANEDKLESEKTITQAKKDYDWLN